MDVAMIESIFPDMLKRMQFYNHWLRLTQEVMEFPSSYCTGEISQQLDIIRVIVFFCDE